MTKEELIREIQNEISSLEGEMSYSETEMEDVVLSAKIIKFHSWINALKQLSCKPTSGAIADIRCGTIKECVFKDYTLSPCCFKDKCRHQRISWG